MLVTITSLSAENVSTDIGLVLPGQTLTKELSPMDAYNMAYDMQYLVERGLITLSVREDPTRSDSLESATIDMINGVPEPLLGAGWVSIADVAVSGGAVSNKVYDDPPNNTIVQSCNVSGLSLLITVKVLVWIPLTPR